ncbi:hypothetical protein [Thermomonospora umbrina]|nr:hypothetical protein [Thermomonospora umbrina]
MSASTARHGQFEQIERVVSRGPGGDAHEPVLGDRHRRAADLNLSRVDLS